MAEPTTAPPTTTTSRCSRMDEDWPKMVATSSGRRSVLGELGELVGGKRQARQVEWPLPQQLVDLLARPLQQLGAAGAPGRPALRRTIALQGTGGDRPVGLEDAIDGAVDGEALMEARWRDL